MIGERLTQNLKPEQGATVVSVNEKLRDLAVEIKNQKIPKPDQVAEALRLVEEYAGTVETITPAEKYSEHIDAIKELIFGQFEPFITDPAEDGDMNHEKFLSLFPEITESQWNALPDKDKTLVNFRSHLWQRSPGVYSLVHQPGSIMSEVMERSLIKDAKEVAEKYSLLVTETIIRPNSLEGEVMGEHYGSYSGSIENLDPIAKMIGGGSNLRFNRVGMWLISNTFPKLKNIIQKKWNEEGLSLPNFEVILTPALVNRRLNEEFPGLSQVKTSELSGTFVVSHDGYKSNMRILVGGSENGGAGSLYTTTNENVYTPSQTTGFRITIAFLKE